MGSFFSSSFDKSEPKILLLGLDNAGKTLTLCKLKFGNVSYVKLSTIPTTDFNKYKSTNERVGWFHYQLNILKVFIHALNLQN